MELMSTLMVFFKRSFIHQLYGHEYGRIDYLDPAACKVLYKRGYIVDLGKGLIITEKGKECILRLSFERIVWLVVSDPRTLRISPASNEIEHILKPKMIRMGKARLAKYLASDVWWIRELAKKVIDMKGTK